jgi:hypothetical protein
MSLLLTPSSNNSTDNGKTQILYNIPIITTDSMEETLGNGGVYSIQKKINKYFYYKFMDKYIYDEYSYLLKYLKLHNDHVVPVLNKEEYKNARLSQMDRHEVSSKIKFIEKYIFKLSDMRRLLIKILDKLDIQWTELTGSTYNRKVVRELTAQQIKKQLKKLLKSFE